MSEDQLAWPKVTARRKKSPEPEQGWTVYVYLAPCKTKYLGISPADPGDAFASLGVTKHAFYARKGRTFRRGSLDGRVVFLAINSRQNVVWECGVKPDGTRDGKWRLRDGLAPTRSE